MLRRRYYRYFFIFFIFGIAEISMVFGAETARDPQWKLSIALLESDGLRIIRLRPTEHFHVVLENRSKKPQKAWKDSNSWGYSALYFELTDETGVKQVIRKRPRTWRKNAPNYWLINNGESLVYDVFSTGRDWDFVLLKSAKLRCVRIQAVIEIPEDRQTQKFGVWSGLIKSAVYEVVILE